MADILSNTGYLHSIQNNGSFSSVMEPFGSIAHCYAQEALTSLAPIETRKHYVWGGNYVGWYLEASPNLGVIQERVPSGSSKARHLQKKSEQFFML